MLLRACRLLVSLLLFFYQQAVQAVPEQDYESQMRDLVVPFFNNPDEAAEVSSADGLKIHYRIYQPESSQNVLFLMQGWTEATRKYAEIIYDLHQAGISVVAFDWRGQGRSERPLDDPQITYVNDYQQYVQDLEAVMAKLRGRFAGQQKVALAHSMGANILSIYLTQHPEAFERIILSSPMLDIRSDPFPEWFVWTVARGMEIFGWGENYVFGHGPFTGYYKNVVTSSDARFRMWLEYKRQDPSHVVNGASWSWVRASLEATWLMKENADQLRQPILMLQAGDDLFVETEGQDKVCALSKLCLKMVFPQAKHEILNEVDRIRNKAMGEVIEFIKFGY